MILTDKKVTDDVGTLGGLNRLETTISSASQGIRSYGLDAEFSNKTQQIELEIQAADQSVGWRTTDQSMPHMDTATGA